MNIHSQTDLTLAQLRGEDVLMERPGSLHRDVFKTVGDGSADVVLYPVRAAAVRVFYA